MKNILISACLLVLIASCKKEQVSQSVNASVSENAIKNEDKYLQNVQRYLMNSLASTDFQLLDFKRAIATKFKNGKTYLLRVQMKTSLNQFLLIKTDSLGNGSKGMIVTITNKENENNVKNKFHSFNGNITVYSLDRKNFSSLQITNGYRDKRKRVIGDMMITTNDNTLPDVTVTAYISAYDGISYADWYNLLDFYSPQELGVSSGGGSGYPETSYGYYSRVNPYDYGYTEDNHVPVQEPKQIAYEDPLLLPSISLFDYLRCFDYVSDIGAICSIEIFTDLPVNGEPNTFFNWNDGSPGHTFLQIKKLNGDQFVQQNIGFYPNEGWKTMLYTPVASKFADDNGHEFNASLKMNITPAQLHTVIATMENLSDTSYDIDQYNCTDFALQVFNSVRVDNPLIIPQYIIPGETYGISSKTPQGLYQKLWSMKEAGVEADNITLPNVCGYVGDSHGPCN